MANSTVIKSDLLEQASKGDLEAMFESGKTALANGRIGMAIGLLKIAAKQGHHQAELTLSSLAI